MCYIGECQRSEVGTRSADLWLQLGRQCGETAVGSVSNTFRKLSECLL